MGHRTVATALLVVCLLTAGCLGSPAIGEEPTGTTPPDLRPAPPGTDGPITSLEPRSTTRCMCADTHRLVVDDAYEGRTSVTLLDSEGEVVARRTYEGRSGKHDFGPAMRYGEDYRVVIWVDSERAWKRPVYDYEAIEVRVGVDGNVTLERISEV